MLVFRYFVLVGAALVGMLFFADWYLPSPPEAESHDSSLMDKTIVRIRSADKWPAKIVIDTKIPTIVPPAAPAEPTAAAAAPTQPPPNALAQARPQDIPKPKQQARVRHRLAKTAPPMRFAVNPMPSWSSGWW